MVLWPRMHLMSRCFLPVFRSGFFLLLGVTAGWAQTDAGKEASRAGQASLTLVNALPGPQNLHVKLGQEDIWPAGFTPGQSTGAVLFPAGKKKVQMLCEGFAQTEGEILMPPGGNSAMVFFPGEEIKDGPDKGKKKIGLFSPPSILPNQPLQGKNWSVLLVGPMDQAKLSLNGQPVELRKGGPSQRAGKGGSMVINYGEKTIFSSSPDVDGNYWVILYGESIENTQAVLLNHVAYTVPK